MCIRDGGWQSGTPDAAGNCFTGNTSAVSAPPDIEAALPCDGADQGSGPSGLGQIQFPPSPPAGSGEHPEPPTDLPDLPDAATAPARPATATPPIVDLDAITVPEAP